VVALSVVLLLFSGMMLVIGLAVRFSGRSTVFIIHEPEKVRGFYPVSADGLIKA